MFPLDYIVCMLYLNMFKLLHDILNTATYIYVYAVYAAIFKNTAYRYEYYLIHNRFVYTASYT